MGSGFEFSVKLTATIGIILGTLVTCSFSEQGICGNSPKLGVETKTETKRIAQEDSIETPPKDSKTNQAALLSICDIESLYKDPFPSRFLENAKSYVENTEYDKFFQLYNHFKSTQFDSSSSTAPDTKNSSNQDAVRRVALELVDIRKRLISSVVDRGSTLQIQIKGKILAALARNAAFADLDWIFAKTLSPPDRIYYLQRVVYNWNENYLYFHDGANALPLSRRTETLIVDSVIPTDSCQRGECAEGSLSAVKQEKFIQQIRAKSEKYLTELQVLYHLQLGDIEESGASTWVTESVWKSVIQAVSLLFQAQRNSEGFNLLELFEQSVVKTLKFATGFIDLKWNAAILSRTFELYRNLPFQDPMYPDPFSLHEAVQELAITLMNEFKKAWYSQSPNTKNDSWSKEIGTVWTDLAFDHLVEQIEHDFDSIFNMCIILEQRQDFDRIAELLDSTFDLTAAPTHPMAGDYLAFVKRYLSRRQGGDLSPKVGGLSLKEKEIFPRLQLNRLMTQRKSSVIKK